jgi:8-oxo-dGTP diphosphatase
MFTKIKIMTPGIRNSVKAVIERDGHVLLIRKRGVGGDYFVFPGGGQDKFETMPDALRRECLEEIGVEVEVLDLRFARDYIARNHEFARDQPETHQVEFYFNRTICDGAEPANGLAMDMDQLTVEWARLANFPTLPVYSLSLREVWFKPATIFCGDIN